MAKGTLTVRLIGDAKPLEQTLRGVGGKLGGFVKGVAKAGAAASAVVAYQGVQAAREAAQINRITENVIKTTGGAAKVSAKEVEELSGNLQKLTGVSDETIQRGSNMLLTFTNIRNEVGKNNDIFDQATGIALDLSVAMGTDVKDSAIQVGKALNDPIKGVTALSRVGIQFTDQQREQIKVLMESGDVLGAQKIILKELETQFGGTAEAAADPLQKLQSVIGDVVEVIGTALLPIVDKVSTWLGDRLPGAVDAAMGTLKQLFNVIFRGDFTGGGPFAEDSPFIASLFRARDIALEVGPKIIGAVRDVAASVVAWWQGTAQPAIVKFGETVQRFWNDTVKPVLAQLATAWRQNKDELGQIVGDLIQIVRSLGRMIATVFSNAESDVQGSTGSIASSLGSAVSVIEKVTNAVARVTAWFERFVAPVMRASQAVGNFMSPLKQATNAFNDGRRALDALRDSFFRIRASTSGVFSGLLTSFRAAINPIIDGWNRLSFSLPGANIPGVGTIGGFTLRTPNIPRLEYGGEVLKTGLAVVHRGERYSGTGGQYPIGGGGDTYSFHFDNYVGSQEELVEAVLSGLAKHSRRGGTLVANVSRQ